MVDNMNSILRKALQLPKILLLRNIVITFYNYLRDYQRYILYSSLNKKKSMQRDINIWYHIIEKGLAFEKSKHWFGKEQVLKLTDLLDIYAENFGTEEEVFHFGLKNIRAYYAKNILNWDYWTWLQSYLQSWLKKYESLTLNCSWGEQEIATREILEASRINQSFFASRHSIRSFSPLKIDEAIIKKAIRISQKTPSVCNRQNTRIHVYSDECQIQELLSYQNGNKGFSNIKNLVIITYEIGWFYWPGERNQWWMDSGMRAMSLIYALHSIWIWSCCLNWCFSSPWKDNRARKIGNIPNSESISMMLAVGYLPEWNIKVTASPELKMETIASFH